MAIIGEHDYTPENAFRVDLLNAIEAHDYHWEGLTFADKDGTRAVSLTASRVEAESGDYARVNELRTDVIAALDEHGYSLGLFQLGDKDENRKLTVKASRDLVSQQMRVPGT